MTNTTLSPAQIDHFLERGHVTLKGCFPRKTANEVVRRSMERLGYDIDDPSTWQEKRVHLPASEYFEVEEFAPTAYAAICELLGGADRIGGRVQWSDSLILNLGIGSTLPWQAPATHLNSDTGHTWHKDGDFFRHFLDSPEQGLLTIVLWTDILPRGGGTFIACDSVAPVAHGLANHPAGIHPSEKQHYAACWIKQCRDLEEVTGEAGDVVLMHPYLLHTASQNHRGTIRAISNPPVGLKEPMNFNRADGLYSPVERAVMNALGATHLDFAITAPRERVIPERERIQQRMREAELQREAG